MKKIAIFASGSGTNAEAIINYFSNNSQVKVELILSNRKSAYVIERANNHSIEAVCFSRDTLYNNSNEILDILNAHQIDLLVLAGFMCLIPQSIIEAYRGRIVNIHPALLPKYGGQGMYGDNVHRAVIAARERESGITIHFVDEHYDQGAIIFQATCPVMATDTAEDLAQRIHILEHTNFPRIIENVLKNQISDMRLLLISNSTNAGEAYLEYPKYEIQKFLNGVSKVLFIPYAGVTLTWDDYQTKVKNRFAEIGIDCESIHNFENPVEAVRKAEAIVVGGGNTFNLLKTMQDNGLIAPIREKVANGTPYVGWSAGSNMACPTLCTTNDMPIVEPQSFKALNLIPFQINPHYLDAHPDGHAGETREQRILEYIQANKGMWVAGLREGCMFRYEAGRLELIGPRPLRVFKYGQPAIELAAGDDLSILL